MAEPIHLGICIPGESMPMESVRCLGRMIMALCTKPPPGLAKVSQHMAAGSMLPHTRATVCSMALEAGATHLLLIDSDMTYPADAAHRLLGADRPFIAANATTRRPPIRWTAKGKDGLEIESHKEAGLTKANSCGLAVCLIEARVYQAIPAPRFNFEYTEDGWIGEDVFFCRAAILAGFQPMIDNALSREIGHVGGYIYTKADLVGAADAG